MHVERRTKIAHDYGVGTPGVPVAIRTNCGIRGNAAGGACCVRLGTASVVAGAVVLFPTANL